VGVPILLLRQRLVNAIIEVFVMGENDMASDIVELGMKISQHSTKLGNATPTKPSGVTSVEARPPGVSFASMIIHDGPSYTESQFTNTRGIGGVETILQSDSGASQHQDR